MMHLLSDGFRVSALMFLVLFGIGFIRGEKPSFRKNIILFFLLTIVCFLVSYWEPLRSVSRVCDATFYLSVSLPYAYWLASKALFDDDFRWKKIHWILSVIIPVGLNVLYYLNEVVETEFWKNFRSLPYLISMGLIVMVIFEAIRNRHTDLVLSRLWKRNTFVVFSAFLALFSVYFFFTDDPIKLPLYFETLQNFVITIFVFLFFNSQFSYRNIFAEKIKKERPTTDINLIIRQRIIKKLMPLFNEEKLFQREGLTISELSGLLNEKEYQVRRAINQELGYTNFNAFLNYYRITEACAQIRAHRESEVTFQEIAFRMGYQSVATFNRAFKNETGLTPGAYLQSFRN